MPSESASLTQHAIVSGTGTFRDGDMPALIQAFNWRASSLGPRELWPASVRGAVTLMLDAGLPMFLAWGRDLAFLYNDAYAPILGGKHPTALAKPFSIVWSDIWPEIAILVDKAMDGETIWQDNLPL